jgi:hypothetical protein
MNKILRPSSWVEETGEVVAGIYHKSDLKES